MSATNAQYPLVKYPSLVLIRGLPGSGKSYLATKLAETLGHECVVLLDPDSIERGPDYEAHSQRLRAEGVDAKLHPYRYLRAQAYRGITEGKVIIWNQPFSNADMFGRLVQSLQIYASEHGILLPTIVVEVAIDPSVAETRIASRKQQGGHGPSHEVFQRFIAEYGSVADQGFVVVKVNGAGDVQDSTAAVLQTLQGVH